MGPGITRCPNCGASVSGDLFLCPSCHAVLGSPNGETTGTSAPSTPARPAAASPARAPGASPFAGDLQRRLSRLGQWGDSAAALGVELPSLPSWARDAAGRAPHPERWAEVIRGVERLAQQKVVAALGSWEQRTRARLARLEAYSVDSRLEREQIEDALHTARVGDLSQALSSYHQVDRVVALKERHLDQARDELEKMLAFLRDLRALGLEPPVDPAEAANELEAELRAGRLAALKQALRTLRQDALQRLHREVPPLVTKLGDRMVADQGRGAPTRTDATELARAARDVLEGRPEAGIRRLRLLAQGGGPTAVSDEPRASGGDGSAT